MRPHVRSLLDQLSRAIHGRAILEATGRKTTEANVEIAALRTRLVAQGLTPIELVAAEAEMRESASRLKRALSKNGRAPAKYLGGLRGRARVSRRCAVASRAREAARYGPRRSRTSYRPFRTDEGAKTRPSGFTKRFHERFGQPRGGLPAIARMTHGSVAPWVALGAYRRALRKVYDRGMAAWATGHCPGATQQQWAYARVYSFILGGPTRRTTDADIAKSIGLEK